MRRIFWLSAATIALLTSLCFSLEYQGNEVGIDFIRYTDGKLSMETRDAALDKVLQALSEVTGITVISDAPIDGHLSIHIHGRPLDKAIKKILRGMDTTFIYGPQPDLSPAGYQLKEVRLFLAEGDIKDGRQYRSQVSRPKKPQQDRRPQPPPRPTKDKPAAKKKPPPPFDTREFLSNLMTGNYQELGELAERLKSENPESEEEIDRFMDYLEEAKARAEEYGSPMPQIEGLEGMGLLMHQMFKGKKSPFSAPDEEEE